MLTTALLFATLASAQDAPETPPTETEVEEVEEPEEAPYKPNFGGGIMLHQAMFSERIVRTVGDVDDSDRQFNVGVGLSLRLAVSPAEYVSVGTTIGAEYLSPVGIGAVFLGHAAVGFDGTRSTTAPVGFVAAFGALRGERCRRLLRNDHREGPRLRAHGGPPGARPRRPVDHRLPRRVARAEPHPCREPSQPR